MYLKIHFFVQYTSYMCLTNTRLRITKRDSSLLFGYRLCRITISGPFMSSIFEFNIVPVDDRKIMRHLQAERMYHTEVPFLRSIIADGQL